MLRNPQGHEKWSGIPRATKSGQESPGPTASRVYSLYRLMPDQLFSPPKPLVVASEDKNPQQLFILLHGEAADPTQLQGLAGAIRQTFPSAAIVLPYGSFRSGEGAYRSEEHTYELQSLMRISYAVFCL